MIRITILGSGCSIPTFERWHPSIALELFYDKYFLILFDCGEGTQLRMMQAGISFMKINFILISHWHADHFAGLIPILQSMQLENRREKIYLIAPDATRMFKNIEGLYYFNLKFPVEKIDAKDGLIFENEYFRIYGLRTLHTVNSFAYKIEEKEKWKINEKRIEELKIRKGKWIEELKRKGKVIINGKEIKIEDVADLIKGKKIVYSGDTAFFEKMIEFCKDADYLIHEATYLDKDKEEREERLHSSVLEAAKIAKEANVKNLILFHFSRRYQSEDYEKIENEAKSIFNGNVVIAKDLLRIE